MSALCLSAPVGQKDGSKEKHAMGRKGKEAVLRGALKFAPRGAREPGCKLFPVSGAMTSHR